METEYKVGKRVVCEKATCGHRWALRQEGRPKQCPRCKSPTWDMPRDKDGRIIREGVAKGVVPVEGTRADLDTDFDFGS